jgi:hypothetical protein
LHKSFFRPLADSLSLVLSESSHNMQSQLVSLRHVTGNELYPALYEFGDEAHIPGKAVQLGNYERRTRTATCIERSPSASVP